MAFLRQAGRERCHFTSEAGVGKALGRRGEEVSLYSRGRCGAVVMAWGSRGSVKGQS